MHHSTSARVNTPEVMTHFQLMNGGIVLIIITLQRKFAGMSPLQRSRFAAGNQIKGSIMQNTKKNFTKSDLSIFISYMLPHRKLFALDMFLSALIAFIDLSFPYITRKAMNSLLPQKMYAAFFAVMAAVLGAYLLRAFFQYKVTVIGHGYGTLVEADMRSDVFAHMQRLSFSFFDKNRTGVLLGRVTNDLFEIVELAHHGPENILTCSLTIAGALIILLFIHPRLTLVLLVLLPVAIYCTMR